MAKAEMNVSLTEALRQFVEAEVSSGRYGSASEVGRDSLRLLQRERAAEDEKLTLLRRAVMEGYDDLAAGRHSELSIDDVAAKVKARGRA